MNRSICIPGVPPVDVSRFERLIDTVCFQALRHRKQLGVNSLIFPGAVHTRFEHSIGVLSLSQRLCTIHHLGEEEALNVQVFALLHDIGHGPFSHQVESILPGNHHTHGAELIDSLRGELASLGVDSTRLRQMFEEKTGLALWVNDRNLGVDKLDYLSRDALHIGFMGTPDIERLQYYTLMTPEGLAIEEKFVEDAKRLQKFYSYLHQHGYLNKTALIAQRMLQRACHEVILEGGTDSASLWNFGDDRLLGFLQGSGNELATHLVERLERRELYKSFLVLKPTGYGYVEREAEKPICVQERSRSELRQFCTRMEHLESLRLLEDTLSRECHCPPGTILFAAMPYFKKLIPKDLRVFARGGHSYWLFEKDVDHKNSLENDYLRTFSVRLICPAEWREKLARKSDEIVNLLFSEVC